MKTFQIYNKSDYKFCQAVCFTETWLQEKHPDDLITPPGFAPYRCDRDLEATGKADGGGICFLINKEWCTNVKILSKTSTPNLEQISIKCRPFYLPREFSSITLTGVYIHPRANIKEALNDLSDIITNNESKDPETASIILGDFNQSNLKTVLPNFHQEVTCPTRGDATLDHCYCKIKHSYRSIERSGLGNSDHSVILLIPKYQQKLKQSKPTTSEVTVWSDRAITVLQNCFDITNWNVFRDVYTTIDELADTVSEYISFCEDICLPKKTVTTYPNSKQWCSPAVHAKIVAKDKAYRNRINDPVTYKVCRSQLRSTIRDAKVKHKEKLEAIFDSRDSRKLWDNMNIITQYKGPKKSVNTDDVTLPDKLNTFYARFDRDNNTTPAPQPVDVNTPPPFSVTIDDVRREFKRLKENKAAGPDRLRPRLLKRCSSELASVFAQIFNWSLQTFKVPSTYKLSNIIPVPKSSSAELLNDFRPVALTSCVMKCFEKIVLKFISTLLPPDFDMFQFAYKENRSVEDALSINCHEVLNHLETSNSYVRILFIDYSSAFNTIIPQKLYDKLLFELKFPVTLCNWILDFLLERPQVVKIGNIISESITLSTGTPQGCPISPKLYSIFTYDCKADVPDNLLIKFADDTTVSGFIKDNDESNYRDQISNIVTWCGNNNLLLNVSKTKEMIIDFRKNKTSIEPIYINNTPVDQVNSFKFLGSFVTNNLCWDFNCNKLLMKARQRLYFLRKLKSFNVNNTILLSFYRSIVESILTSSITVWYDKASVYHKGRIDSVVRQAERIINTSLPSIESIYLNRMNNKTTKMLKDKHHPAHAYFQFLPSMKRMRTFKGNKRFTNSFFPQAVKYYNNTRDK